MKKLLIILILVLSGCQSTSYSRLDITGAHGGPCVWWYDNECHCKQSRKIIYVTSNTDFSKLYEYCRNVR